MELVPEQIDALRKIRFIISARMTRAAGKARINTGEITLSLPYFADESNFGIHFEETVTHEIAHILAPPMRTVPGLRRELHGRTWRAMHRRLGGKGERCHDMDLAIGFERKTRQRAARVEVSCSCGCGQPMKLGPTQYNRYAAGTKYFLKGHAARMRRGPFPFFS